MTRTQLLLSLAWRNLWRHARRTILTVLALGLGLGLLLVSLGLGDGSHEQMIVNGIKLGGGHVVIQAEGYQHSQSQDLLIPARVISTVDQALRTDRTLHSINPRLLASGLLSSAANASGVGIVGVQPHAEQIVSLIPQRMIAGSYLDGEQSSGLVIGDELAQKLKVRVGSKVVLMAQAVHPEADKVDDDDHLKTQQRSSSALQQNGAGGEIQSALFRVVGIFHTGLREVDAYLVHLPLPEAQTFLGAGDQLSQIAVFLRQDSATVPTADALRTQLSPTEIEVLTWRQALAELARFVWLDDAFNYVMNGIILVMVALGVLNTMLMAVLERRYELGVCAAVGLQPTQLLTLVMYESVLLILLSLVLGLILGLGGHWYFATYGLDMRVFTETDMPIAGTVFDPILYSSLSYTRIIWAVSVVGALALLMAAYPAWKAARTELPGALRTM
jgi:ABC-type lipoprotein release transport system permease subunit